VAWDILQVPSATMTGDSVAASDPAASARFEVEVAASSLAAVGLASDHETTDVSRPRPLRCVVPVAIAASG